MISMQEAKRIAVTYGPGSKFPLHDTAIDLGDCWYFFFQCGTELQEMIPPGLPGAVLISKKDGTYSYPPTPATEPDLNKLKEFESRLETGAEVTI